MARGPRHTLPLQGAFVGIASVSRFRHWRMKRGESCTLILQIMGLGLLVNLVGPCIGHTTFHLTRRFFLHDGGHVYISITNWQPRLNFWPSRYALATKSSTFPFATLTLISGLLPVQKGAGNIFQDLIDSFT